MALLPGEQAVREIQTVNQQFQCSLKRWEGEMEDGFLKEAASNKDQKNDGQVREARKLFQANGKLFQANGTARARKQS